MFFKDVSSEVMTDDVMARLLTFNNVIVTGHQVQSILKTRLFLRMRQSIIYAQPPLRTSKISNSQVLVKMKSKCDYRMHINNIWLKLKLFLSGCLLFSC